MKTENPSSLNSKGYRSLRGNFARRPSCRSSALIITLITLSLLALVAVALAFIVRVDRMSAQYFRDDSRAALFSDQGVNHAVALLRTLSSSTNISGATNYWIVQPGQGYVSASGVTNQAPTTVIPLHSGLGASTDPDLNITSFQAPNNYAIDSSNAPPMRVQWIYVDQQGKYTTTPPATYNAADPIVGRYGFWVDCENNRLNLNTAYTRDPATTNALSPDNIDLTALPEVDSALVDKVHTYVTANPLNSPDGVRLVDSNVTNIGIFNTNKFITTYYNHDPDMTYWGAPKIVLTTQKNLAGGRPFLDILTTDNTDPGPFNNLDTSTAPDTTKKLTKTIHTLTTYLGHPDWPAGAAGQSPWPVAPSGNLAASFSTKFFGNTTQDHQLIQLAIQIIDYVRAKESKSPLIQSISGTIDGNGYYYHNFGDNANDVFSKSRQICITEMGAYVPAKPTPGTIQFPSVFKMELFLPPNYGLSSYDVSQLFVYIVWDTQWYDPNYTTASSLSSANVVINGSASTMLSKGGYATVSIPFTYNNTEFPSTNRPTGLLLKSTIVLASDNDPAKSIDNGPTITHYFNAGVGTVPYTVDSTNIPSSNITSIEVDDPRVNQHWQDWHQHSPGTPTTPGNTFGAQNSNWKQGTTLYPPPFPEQDSDGAPGTGLMSDASFYMPAPKGQTGNLDGVVHSVAELGYVLTGIQGEMGPGVPWRTLHFQPMGQPGIGAKAYLPDWAIMNLFSVPINPATRNTSLAMGSTDTNYVSTIPGRVNLNSTIAPFEPTVSLGRTAPLNALLINTTNRTTPPATVISNINGHILAAKGQTYTSAGTSIYTMPGELAEIQGIADTGEASELGLRDIVDLATTQSDVFRVYSIGQALQQTKNSTAFSVMGEHRDCSLIERTVSSTGAVSFHVVYHRNITF